MNYTPLFQPISVGPLRLKNRFVMAPMSVHMTEDGSVSDAEIAYTERRAMGGVSMIIVGSLCIWPDGNFGGQIFIHDDGCIPGLDDSKKLTEKRREELYDKIMQTAVYAKVILASPEEIDRVNILNATKNAMAMAAKDAPCDLFLVDAITRLDVPGEVRGLVHGDALCYSIAAASILAKVTRDRIMRELDARYPQYGLAKNKGYGTAEHIAALRQYGPTPIHRRSFIGHFVEV